MPRDFCSHRIAEHCVSDCVLPRFRQHSVPNTAGDTLLETQSSCVSLRSCRIWCSLAATVGSPHQQVYESVLIGWRKHWYAEVRCERGECHLLEAWAAAGSDPENTYCTKNLDYFLPNMAVRCC